MSSLTLDQTKSQKVATHKTIEIDACGLQCPAPLLKLREAITSASDHDIIEIKASDQGFYRDVESYSQMMNLKILSLERGETITAKLEKLPHSEDQQIQEALHPARNKQLTMVIFSNDFDKVMAALIIANGAISLGKKVSLFFTFWGLNVLRKDNRVKVRKTLIERMFGLMMPRGTKGLLLSKMNMFGLGTKMMKGLMDKYKVLSPEKLLDNVVQHDGRLIACTMTMYLMGIKREELIEGIDEGGVGSFIGDAEKGAVTLFI